MIFDWCVIKKWAIAQHLFNHAVQLITDAQHFIMSVTVTLVGSLLTLICFIKIMLYNSCALFMVQLVFLRLTSLYLTVYKCPVLWLSFRQQRHASVCAQAEEKGAAVQRPKEKWVVLPALLIALSPLLHPPSPFSCFSDRHWLHLWWKLCCSVVGHLFGVSGLFSLDHLCHIARCLKRCKQWLPLEWDSR